jgi:hypothetical protein
MRRTIRNIPSYNHHSSVVIALSSSGVDRSGWGERVEVDVKALAVGDDVEMVSVATVLVSVCTGLICVPLT